MTIKLPQSPQWFLAGALERDGPSELSHFETREPALYPAPPHSDETLGMGGNVALEQGLSG